MTPRAMPNVDKIRVRFVQVSGWVFGSTLMDAVVVAVGLSFTLPSAIRVVFHLAHFRSKCTKRLNRKIQGPSAQPDPPQSAALGAQMALVAGRTESVQSSLQQPAGAH